MINLAANIPQTRNATTAPLDVKAPPPIHVVLTLGHNPAEIIGHPLAVQGDRHRLKHLDGSGVTFMLLVTTLMMTDAVDITSWLSRSSHSMCRQRNSCPITEAPNVA